MIQREDAGAHADADAPRARRDVRRGNERRREEVAALVVGVEVTLAKPDRVEAGLLRVLHLVQQALVARGRGAGGVEADLHASFHSH